jgi:hypothetical protein
MVSEISTVFSVSGTGLVNTIGGLSVSVLISLRLSLALFYFKNTY